MELIIKLRKVSVPLREPFRTSYGSVGVRESIIVEIQQGGHCGFGEAAPMPESIYSKETPDSTWVALEDWYLPLWMSKTFQHPSEVGPVLDQIPGEGFPRAALEGAAWDLACRQAGQPLWQMLGSQPRPVESGLAVGITDTVDELLERIRHHREQGYQRVKIKIQPGWDVEPVRKIREHFGAIPLMVDANAAYRLDDLAVFQELDPFGLLMLEQPLAADALEESAELQRIVQTPVCLDESADTLDALETIVELGAARIINIKVQRVGGLTSAKKMYDRARAAGLEVWLGCMPELGVGSAQGLHLATLPGFAYPTDIEASERFYGADIVQPAIEISPDGLIRIPDGPGTGYQVDREKLEEYTVREVEFSR